MALAIVGGATSDDADSGGTSLFLKRQLVPAEYRDWVVKAGTTCTDVSSPLIAAQIEAESNWGAHRTSPAGAQGISQFMPGTWKTWGVDADNSGTADVFSAPDAIMTQARYDCWLAKKVRSYKIENADVTRLMLAAYNAGPDAVRAAHGMPPFPETQQYVDRITKLISKYAEGEQGSAFGSQVVAAAERWMGTPYSWGGGSVDGPSYGVAQGASIKGFDCSSLVQNAVYHASHGSILLPRTSQAQATQGKAISKKDIQVGDVIAFALNGPGDYDHIGIYIGNGMMVHAPRTGQDVRTASLTDAYYASKPQKIRRFG
ncbi:C40 family peptidase [Streptomyces sp. NBC_01197]|uniref:C40 family peptidase n=1 Tax=Streptomyces sp. NBC_01197 TaxID=2903768 RepID=UPI002E0FBCBD|nr:NlpC/P60 family protein [Streptomyces sp. NBC_01197]